MISDTSCDILILSDGVGSNALQTVGGRNMATLKVGEVYSLKLRNKLPRKAPFVLHTRVNMVVLDAIVIGPGDDIMSPIPKLSDWLKRQPIGEETERISFDIFPLKCTKVRKGKEVPYEGITPFSSRRMYTEDLLDPKPMWSSYFTVPSDISVSYSNPTRPLCSLSVTITFPRTPSEIDLLRQKVTSMETALTQLTTKYVASQTLEKSLRRQLEKEEGVRVKLQRDLDSSEKQRANVEGQLSQTKTKLHSVTTRMEEMTAPMKKEIQRLETEVKSLLAKDDEMQALSSKLMAIDGRLNSLLQERQQLVDCMGRSECAVNSSLKRKLSSAPVGDAGNRSVRQRMDDWPSTLRAEGSPGHEQPQSPLTPILPSVSSALQAEANTFLKSILDPETPVRPPPTRPTQPLFLPSPTLSISGSCQKISSVSRERNSRLDANRTKDPRSRH